MDQHQFDALIKALTATKFTEVITVTILVLSFLIAIGSLLYARRQLIAADLQLRADHARSRRQLAMEMCSRWSGSTSPETSSVTRLVEQMTPGQCESLANLGKLSIGVQHKALLVNILELRFPDIETKLEPLRKGDTYEIEGRYLLHIRHIAVRYLNMLESILLSWTMAIADQQIIENEFSYLFDEKHNRTAMEELRTKIGIEAFPAIDQFTAALRERNKRGLKEIIRPSGP
jgi:hypothetical protein